MFVAAALNAIAYIMLTCGALVFPLHTLPMGVSLAVLLLLIVLVFYAFYKASVHLILGVVYAVLALAAMAVFLTVRQKPNLPLPSSVQSLKIEARKVHAQAWSVDCLSGFADLACLASIDFKNGSRISEFGTSVQSAVRKVIARAERLNNPKSFSGKPGGINGN